MLITFPVCLFITLVLNQSWFSNDFSCNWLERVRLRWLSRMLWRINVVRGKEGLTRISRLFVCRRTYVAMEGVVVSLANLFACVAHSCHYQWIASFVASHWIQETWCTYCQYCSHDGKFSTIDATHETNRRFFHRLFSLYNSLQVYSTSRKEWFRFECTSHLNRLTRYWQTIHRETSSITGSLSTSSIAALLWLKKHKSIFVESSLWA